MSDTTAHDERIAELEQQLAAEKAVSEGRRKVLLEKADQLRHESIRADNAEADGEAKILQLEQQLREARKREGAMRKELQFLADNVDAVDRDGRCVLCGFPRKLLSEQEPDDCGSKSCRSHKIRAALSHPTPAAPAANQKGT